MGRQKNATCVFAQKQSHPEHCRRVTFACVMSIELREDDFLDLLVVLALIVVLVQVVVRAFRLVGVVVLVGIAEF